MEMLVYDMPCKHAHTDWMLQSWLRWVMGCWMEERRVGLKWWMTRSLVFSRPARAEWVLAEASRLLRL